MWRRQFMFAYLFQERESWEEKERDYLQKIDEITDNHLTKMDQDRVCTFMHYSDDINYLDLW